MLTAALIAFAPSRSVVGQAQSAPTFTKDVAPILQRSCQSCHRPNSVAPMSLITYEEVRPWARSIKQRTGLGGKMGTMPPWFIDKTVGIQDYKDDFSLSEKEIATLAAWVDAGAPARQSCRHALATGLHRSERVGDRSAGYHRRLRAGDHEGERAGLVGRAAAQADRPD